MKRILLLLVLCLAVSANALVIDDFSNGLGNYTPYVILDANGGSSNTAAWQISSGQLQLSTTVYDGIEQYAFIRNNLILPVGAEVQIDIARTTGSQDIGLYVGGTTPQTGVRQDYVAMYARSDGDVFSRGFDGTGEYGLAGDWNNPAFDKLFIARTGENTYETGWYNGETRTILATRTPTNANVATVVGFYADVRALGVNGNADNLAIISNPYDPTATQTQDGANNIDVLLEWNAAADPNAGASGLDVDPAIAAQYIFVGNADDDDPNLYYKGSAGDPENTVASSFDLQDSIENDTTYDWVIVSAMSGYEQDLTVDSSTLNDVDPNNYIGSTWSFDSLTSIPTISVQPAGVRVFSTEPSAVITCEFVSVDEATVEWYLSGTSTPLSTEGDIVISTTDDGNGNYVSSLEFLTPEVADEGDYLCIIDNGTPPITSDSAYLIIKQLLAQYDFDGDLAPATGSASDAATGQGKSLEGLADANSLLAADVTLTFVEGVDGQEGHAVQIDSVQYVDFGTDGYPKASGLIDGLGRGLDEGSVICWVKPATTGAVLANFNDGATTGGMLSVAANGDTADARMIVRGDSTEYTEIGTVQGRSDRPGWDMFDGAWHLVATTWSAGGTMILYVDGQQVASVAAGSPDGYLSWERGVLLGAGRSGTRYILSELLDSVVDDLRIYNYEIDADSISQEYLDATGIHPCVDSDFVGNFYNTNNSGDSYCRIDLADFADFAAAWLTDGLY